MAYLWRGYGKRNVAVTDAKATIDLADDYAYNVSVYNSGESDVSVCLGASDDTDSVFVIADGIVIPAGTSFSFSDPRDHAQNNRIYKLFYACPVASEESTINVSFS